MSLDLRPLTQFTGNATVQAQILQEIVEDHAIRAEILWAAVVLMHFARLLPLDAMLVHVFVMLLRWTGERRFGEAGTFVEILRMFRGILQGII